MLNISMWSSEYCDKSNLVTAALHWTIWTLHSHFTVNSFLINDNVVRYLVEQDWQKYFICFKILDVLSTLKYFAIANPGLLLTLNTANESSICESVFWLWAVINDLSWEQFVLWTRADTGWHLQDVWHCYLDKKTFIGLQQCQGWQIHPHTDF